MTAAEHNARMLTAYYGRVGAALSARIGVLWPWLPEADRDDITAQTSEDGMRAVLDRIEAGDPAGEWSRDNTDPTVPPGDGYQRCARCAGWTTAPLVWALCPTCAATAVV